MAVTIRPVLDCMGVTVVNMGDYDESLSWNGNVLKLDCRQWAQRFFVPTLVGVNVKSISNGYNDIYTHVIRDGTTILVERGYTDFILQDGDLLCIYSFND